MKKLFNIVWAISFIIIALSFSVADFYSSMTKVDYIEGSKTLKFTTKINAQHISNVLKVPLNAPNFKSEVEKYLNRNFEIAINGTPGNLTITGSQVNGETIWVYSEANGVGEIQTLKIRNSILLEAYPKQFNVVNIVYKGQQKTMNFSKGKDRSEVSF